MNDLGTLLLRVEWGGRSESPEQITERVHLMFAAFRRFGGVLARDWVDNDNPERVVSGPGPALLDKIRAGVDTNKAGETSPRYGYNAYLRTVTAENWWPHETPPVYASVSVTAGNEFGNAHMAVNRLLLKFQGIHPYEVEVLPRAEELIRELVSIWEPDHADLDSRALLKAHARQKSADGDAVPTVGFVSWLSDRVFSGVGDVPVHSCERFRDGTLLSVDVGSVTMFDDTIALSRELNGRGLLHPVPTNQSDPATH